jgi:ubiquinone/menaquinone biosynthesis C-methylase UbiE
MAKKAIRSLKDIEPKQILDVATGTADLAIAALKAQSRKSNGSRSFGTDAGSGKGKSCGKKS